MKKGMILMALVILAGFSCSKKNITNNYYGPTEEGARIIGIVHPPESGATVTAYMGILVASTQIDSTGYFKLSGLFTGSYSLIVQAEGYYEETRKISVEEHYTTVADTIHLALLGELISSVSPSDGTQGVKLSEFIMVRFRNPMNQESLKEAFQIKPTVKGHFYWYLAEPLVRFVPEQSLAASTLYQVIVDTTAFDTAGVKLSQKYEFTFTTEPIRIEYTRPSHNQAGVQPYDRIMVRFNTEMDGGSVISAFRMVDSGLRVVMGDFTWSDLRSMSFKPNSNLAANETYTVTIDSTAEDIHGGKLSEPYRFSFSTESIKIEYTNPGHNSTQVYPLTRVRVVFNTEMDVESVNLAFSMFDSRANGVIGKFYWSNLQQLEFRPDSALFSVKLTP